ncbi:hypothetical protein CORT_0E05370 [Candida orthopsilosis Co 90-125]|uniref:Protein HIR n=1 Tax=Candida orthopsilosis (strain 90-125) TaxID=1136231 RepID=H8X823_CANO9|nr:hypothetical protein CORT_0E05370 [Candida orthopsilosis Co 90-125]CCG24122.1 hypothetical protein CORT_0E05370 [Candida orthopsilosis Co 90-125]
MKFLLLPQTLHDGEVHCMAISNDSTVLVTGGKDNTINLWNVAQLLDISNLDNDANNKDTRVRIDQLQPLQQIKCQESFMNNIQWIPGSYNSFISTTSKGHVYFHELGFEAKVTSKQIYPFKVEQTGLSPIVDVSISRDGKLVAWSSTDGKLSIYDLQRNTLQELLSPAEDNLVVQRSIAFNGVTNYLTSIGDDTQITLFQYEYDPYTKLYKFRLVNKISKLFSKNPLNVRYKRVSWSPDGELISIPTASKGQTSLISLVSSTKSWTTTASLVGHDLTCEVTKFSRHLYSETRVEENNLYNVIASGGSDGTIAIWNTSKTSPIMVLKHVVDAQIYDIVWTINSSILFCTSKGNLGILRFYPDELGYEVSTNEMNELKAVSVKSMKPMNFRYEYEQVSGNRKTLPPIEYIDQATAIVATGENYKTRETRQTRQAHETKMQVDESEKTTTIEKVDPTITKGQIVPEVVTAATPIEDVKAITTQKEVPDKPSPKLTAKEKEPKSPSTTATSQPQSQPPTQSQPQPNLSKQKITTKDGKRRIQPILISNNGTSATNNSKLTQSQPIPEDGVKSAMEFDPPSYSVSEEFSRSKRARTEEQLPNGNGDITKKPKREMEPVKFIGSVVLNPNVSFAKVRLPTPKIRFGFQLKSKKVGDEFFTLDIKNGSGNEAKPSRVTYFKRDKEIWCDFVPKFVHLACEGSNFWAVATADGEILTYSHISGKRLLPPLILGAPISFLESHGKFLMVVTCIGEMYVWDLELKKIELKTSIASLLELGSKLQETGLTKSDFLTLCAITSQGIPLVTCSNGSGYLYNKNLGIWQTITESWWAFGSHYWDSVDTDKTKAPQSLNMFDEEESIIQLLEQKTNEEIMRKSRSGRGKLYNKISKNMIMKEGFESLENTISISHLENRILCCELLGENKDFHQYFCIYVQRICELGYKAKLYEVCDELLGPIDQDKDSSDVKGWNPKICGLDKRELLKEVIDLCSQYRDSQRVLYHFSKKLGLVEEE